MTVDYFLMVHRVDQAKSISHVMNLSSHQRMLSQKIAMLARFMSRTHSPYEVNDIKDELLLALNEVKTIHHGLIDGNEDLGLMGTNSEVINKIYYGKQYQLDKRVNFYLNAGHAYLNSNDISWKNPDLQYLLYVHQSGELLESMTALVSQFQKESETYMTELEQNGVWIYFGTLLVLLFISVFIFRPMILHIRKERNRLIASNRLLERRNMDIRKSRAAALNMMEDANEARRLAEKTKEQLHGLTKELALSNEDLEKINQDLQKEIQEKEYAKQLETNRNMILEKLASGTPLEEILGDLIMLTESFKPGMLCSILTLDRTNQSLRHLVAPSLPQFYNQAVDGMKIGLGKGSCGTAAFTGERVIVSDIMEHEYWEDYRDLALKANLRSCWSEPIVSSSQKVLGTLALYHHYPHEPSEDDLKFIKTTAHLAGIAIEKRKREDKIQHTAAQLERSNAALRNLVSTDPLTGLLNRRGLQQVLSHEIQVLKRSGASLMALLVDLDNFKDVNESLGHAVGDIVLREVAKVIEKTLRASDYVSRIGGDEFLILLPDTKPSEGMHFSERLRLAIAESPAIVSNNKPIKVTASLGVAVVDKEKPSIDELLEDTHVMLAKSKNLGKNRSSYADDNDEDRLQDVVELLRRGKHFRTVKHPIYDLNTEQEVACELLARSEIEGFQMPYDFFNISTEANILTMVDHHCLKTSIKTSSKLPKALRRHVNVMPSTMIDIPTKSLVELFPDIQDNQDYCVEISEQQILGDPSYLVDAVAALKQHGVKIAIDDVGFGRSCLESLILLQPDIIKIDRSVVQGVHENSGRKHSLKRLLKVTNSLGAEVIVEGIETKEELEALKQLGVTYGQGFYWGKPATF